MTKLFATGSTLVNAEGVCRPPPPLNTPYNALYGEVPPERGSFLSRPE